MRQEAFFPDGTLLILQWQISQSIPLSEMEIPGHGLMIRAPVEPVNEPFHRGGTRMEQTGKKPAHLLDAHPDCSRRFFLKAAREDGFWVFSGAGAGAGKTFDLEMTSAACAIMARVMCRCHPVQLRTS